MDSGTGMSKILIREFQYNSQVPSSPFPSAHFPVEKFSGNFLESQPGPQFPKRRDGDWGLGTWGASRKVVFSGGKGIQWPTRNR